MAVLWKMSIRIQFETWQLGSTQKLSNYGWSPEWLGDDGMLNAILSIFVLVKIVYQQTIPWHNHFHEILADFTCVIMTIVVQYRISCNVVRYKPNGSGYISSALIYKSKTTKVSTPLFQKTPMQINRVIENLYHLAWLANVNTYTTIQSW